MKYLILLIATFNISLADITLTDQQVNDLYEKIEKCKLYKEKMELLEDSVESYKSQVAIKDSIITLQESEISLLKETADLAVESCEDPWYEHPAIVAISSILLSIVVAK